MKFGFIEVSEDGVAVLFDSEDRPVAEFSNIAIARAMASRWGFCIAWEGKPL